MMFFRAVVSWSGNGDYIDRERTMLVSFTCFHCVDVDCCRMELEDVRALTPLIYAHVNQYGSF
ncbi:MAG: hypothetical protein R3E01_00410 [Pirellulaceae bacterium]